MTTPLLHTKLMLPRNHAAVVERPELLERLDEALEKKLALVSAPTGFGKTTLVSMWLAARKIPAAWVALDVNDNDPVRFWTYVISSLRTLDPAIGKTALSALTGTQLPSFQNILTPLLNELASLSKPGVLVLEDYQAITAVEIHQAMAFFLQYVPAPLHLVIISRARPDLPLGILRARDELLEINGSDLRFNRVETESFLRGAVKSEIPLAALEKLYDQTEGWAAGLRLAALALQNKDGKTAAQMLENFSGSHRFVADYLTHEVFANQPEQIRSFLLKTCFMNRLTGALCDAITGAGDGESILELLERENLFLVHLEHGHGRTWYRYNALFAESIQVLARQQLGEVGIQSVFEKASAWYATQQRYDEAIEMALAAGLSERAVGLIETFVEIYDLNQMRTLARWLERIPDALTLRSPKICMAYAQVILYSSDRFAPATGARLEPYLRAAETTWQAAGDEAKVGTVLALRGMVLLWQGDFQHAMQCVHSALEKMPEHEVFWRGISLLNSAAGELYAGRMLSAQDQILEARALLGASQNIYGMMAASGMLCDIFFAQGDLELCAQLNQQIMADAVGEESMLDDQGEARLRFSHIAYEQNDLETAARYAGEAFEMGKQRANELLQAQAASHLGLIHAARNEPALEELKALAARLQSPLALRELRNTQALLAVRAGESLGAWQGTDQDTLHVQKERETFILARQRMAEGRPGEALALLEPYLAETLEHGRVRSLVEALCLQALAHQAAGDLTEAGQSITRALKIGHEKGFRRLFLDEGAPMALLLREILPALNKRSLSLFASTLLRLFSPELVSDPTGASGSEGLVEPLSQQELRVLKLLAAGLSNGEIASELIVSANTVKTHIKNIYRKLNIRSREETRAMVKELKLL